MTFEARYVFNINEADIDLLIAEEYECNPSFRSWLLSQVNCKIALNEPPIFLGRSVSNYHGENDLLIVYRAAGNTKHAILIENKISAPPTAAQAERYVVRGDFGQAHGDWESFITVLIAPNRYLAQNKMKFDYLLSYEELIKIFDDIDDLRSAFKCRLIEAAIAKAKKPWVANPVPKLTAWFVDARNFAISEFPDLPLPEEGKGRSPTSKWITFYLSQFPMSRVGIEIKAHNGHVDLRFNGVDLGEMRRALAERLPSGADTVEAKSRKSCAIRLVHPRADMNMPFETQKDLVRHMMYDADRLLRFAREQHQVIMQLLGYGRLVASNAIQTAEFS